MLVNKILPLLFARDIATLRLRELINTVSTSTAQNRSQEHTRNPAYLHEEQTANDGRGRREYEDMGLLGLLFGLGFWGVWYRYQSEFSYIRLPRITVLLII